MSAELPPHILNDLPLPAWITRADGSIAFVNAALLEYSGASGLRLETEGWQWMVHPADLSAVGDAWKRALSTGEPFEIECRLLQHSDRQYHWHLVRASAQRHEKGAIQSWLGVQIDIDRFRRAEEASTASMTHMRKERERVRSLFAQSPAAISVSLGREHRIDLTNARFRQLIGERYIEGKTVREAFPELESQGFFELLDQVYQTGQPYHGQEVRAEFQRDDSGTLGEGYFNIHYQPLFDDSGQVYGIMSLSIEVTDQVLSRRQVERLAAERAAVLSQLTEGVIIADVAGRITFVNEAANQMHGVTRLDVTPDKYSETYHLLTVTGEPHPSEQLPLARAVLRDETVHDARWKIRRPDGSVILAQGSARPVFGTGGEKIGAVLTLRQIQE
jgi:PAS domain S-box-containing protein